MTGVVLQGMRKEEQDNDVRLAATQALYNAIEFASTNFRNETERNYLMQVKLVPETSGENKTGLCAGMCCHCCCHASGSGRCNAAIPWSSTSKHLQGWHCVLSVCCRFITPTQADDCRVHPVQHWWRG